MFSKKPVIVFNFENVSLEFESVKETSKQLNMSEGKVRRVIDKGTPVKTSMGRVFFDFKIEEYDDGKKRRR